MLEKKRSRKENKLGVANKAVVLLMAAAIVTLAVSGVGAQEKGSTVVSLSEQETISLNVTQMEDKIFVIALLLKLMGNLLK